MTAFKATVRNGRLILDEPTELPEGKTIELVPVDPYEHLDDPESQTLSPDEKARLDATVETAYENYKAGGQTFSAQEVIDKLHAKA